MTTSEIENAIINSTHLGYEDHGTLTAMLTMTGDGWGQGFGGMTLRPRDGNAMAEFVERTLKAVGVDRWEKLKGQHARIRREHGRIVAIGHIVEDRWFNPMQDIALFREAAAS